MLYFELIKAKRHTQLIEELHLTTLYLEHRLSNFNILILDFIIELSAPNTLSILMYLFIMEAAYMCLLITGSFFRMKRMQLEVLICSIEGLRYEHFLNCFKHAMFVTILKNTHSNPP